MRVRLIELVKTWASHGILLIASPGGWGGGALPGKLGGGVRPASQNSYPIYDQNLRYFLPAIYDLTKNSKHCS